MEIKIKKVESLPAPTAKNRGLIFLLEHQAGLSDELFICVKKSDETYGWARIPLTF